MRVYPAIDLRGGRVVRLLQGRANAETVYFDDAARPAAAFRRAGMDWVHVVDLDGAFTGAQANREAVGRVLASGLKVQLGGGIRSIEVVEYWLGLGVQRLVIGTMAATQPAFVAECLRNFPPAAFAVGMDARDGKVSIRGWVEDLPLQALDFARQVEDLGVQTIIYTDISRDGMLGGPNFAAQEELLKAVSMRVIASGGVGNAADIERFREIGKNFANLDGVIVGKAIYDGALGIVID